MKKRLKISIPIVMSIGLLLGIQANNKSEANPPPAPTQTTVTATGFGSYSQIKLSIIGVPVDCTTCWRAHTENFTSPGSTIVFQTGDQYIDTRNTAYDEGRSSVYYWESDYPAHWQYLGWIDNEEFTTGTTNGWITNIQFSYSDLEFAAPEEE